MCCSSLFSLFFNSSVRLSHISIRKLSFVFLTAIYGNHIQYPYVFHIIIVCVQYSLLVGTGYIAYAMDFIE